MNNIKPSSNSENMPSHLSWDKYAKYIVPIYGKYERSSATGKSIFDTSGEIQICETILGTGTLVGDLLITAAHILKNANDPFIKFDNRAYALTDENKVLQIKAPEGQGFEVYSDLKCGDIAIFRMASIFSPIELAESIPTQGQVLNNRFYCSQYKDGLDTVGIMSNDEGIAGNFFTCEMRPQHPTEGGSSGSPIINGKNLYGVLHGGKDDYCVFYSTLKANISSLIEKNT